MLPESNTFAGEPEEDNPGAETAESEGETGESTEGSESDLPEDVAKRLKGLQAWNTRVSQENASLKSQLSQMGQNVQQLINAQTKAQPGNAGPSQKEVAALNARVQQIAETEGAAAAIDWLANERIKATVAPLYEELAALKVQLATPDYNDIKDDVQQIWADVRSGKISHVDQLVLEVARARKAMAKAGAGTVTRQADRASRGATTGNRSGGAAPSAQADLATRMADMGSAADMARAAIKSGTLTPAEKQFFYTQHPELRPKE